MEEAIRNYADRNYTYVIIGGQLNVPVAKIAPDYPETNFIITAAIPDNNTIPQNMLNIEPISEQSGFLAGILAGNLTKSNRIGLISGISFPDLVRWHEAFKLGATIENPLVEISEIYTGSFTDVSKAFEAGIFLILNGVDIIFEDVGSGGFGVANAVKQSNNVWLIGNTNDRYFLAPERVYRVL